MGTRVDTRGGNGEYRRCRAVGALACFLSHLSWNLGNDGLNVRIVPRRGGGDTRRFPPAYRRACPYEGGYLWRFCRRRNFVRQCSRVISPDPHSQQGFKKRFFLYPF